MPRNGAGTYSLPGTYEAISGETILATQHNDPLEDLQQDANTVRPIVAGGTGAATAIAANDALNTTSVNLASSATVDLSTATGTVVNITGTTTITALGTVSSGSERVLVFAGILTLTHNATSLILPGAANVTTAAGDIATMRSKGSGNWVCVSYQQASGIGGVEIATDPEVQTGTNATKAVSPAGLTSKEATVANYRANTADRILTTDIVWTSAAEVTLTDGATIAIDFSTFINGVVTLAGNRAMGNPTNEKVGQSGCIRIVQDGTGSRTLSYGTDWEFAGGTAPVLTTTAGATDLLFYHIIAADRIFANLVKAVA
ncbi:MAG: hypothetical protein E5Y10_24390 [Mesorhizobium sp.]|nr:MAG: hypothetical protein E5Y10_24390 [Mesorhizobium sp.]